MPTIPRITGLVQGVTFPLTLRWAGNTPAIVIDPKDYYADLTIVQYAEATAGVETALKTQGAQVLERLSTRDRYTSMTLYPDRLEAPLRGALTRKWPLQAQQDPISRTEGADTVTLAYPNQLLHLHLQILRHDRTATMFPKEFELELEMEPRFYG